LAVAGLGVVRSAFAPAARAVDRVSDRAQEREKKGFFDLADRLARSSDPEQQKQLEEDLARMTFGE
jgi:hypothetical protein